MKIYAFESSDWLESTTRGISKDRAITQIDKGLRSSAYLLPSLSKQLNIVIRPYLQGLE